MITCDCGYRWRYRGSSWRTHCRECRKGYYIPVSRRLDAEEQRTQSERGQPTTFARGATTAPSPEPLIAPPMGPIEEPVPRSLERVMGGARSRPPRPGTPGPALPVWQRIGDVVTVITDLRSA